MPTIDKIRVGSTDYDVKDGKALHLPTAAPSAVALIGVGTDNAQKNVAIGEGLVVENDTLKATGISGDSVVTGVKGNAETEYRKGSVNITPENIGLGKVNNTSDADKPISTATQSALNGKVDKTTTVNGHALSGNVSVTKGDVGLGNVTNDAQVKRTEMGVAGGVATLGADGKVLAAQLPESGGGTGTSAEAISVDTVNTIAQEIYGV